jgi:hypothetical protein
METEQTCPYCKRVHYSIYTVERCAARHQVSREFNNYLNEEREKRKKQTTDNKIERIDSFGEFQNK